MSGEYPRGILELWEDFLTDNVTDLNETVADAGAQDITNKHGGWWRQTTIDETDAVMLAGERAWEVDEGHPLIFETRLVTDDSSVSSISVGFGDDPNQTAAILFEDEAGTLASECADGFAFMLEGPQDETWQAVAVDTDVDETQVALTNGADAADDVVQTLRLEANPNDSGTVKYFIDGELVKTKTSWFDSAIVFCPVLSCDFRTSAINVDYDYLYVSSARS